MKIQSYWRLRMIRFILSGLYAFVVTCIAIEMLHIRSTSLAIVIIAILLGQIIFKKI